MSSVAEERLLQRFPNVAERVGRASPNFGDAVQRQKKSADWSALQQRWIDGLDLKPNTAIALAGLGDGSHLEALLDRLPSGCFVFCGEYSPEVAAACFSSPIGEKLLKDQRVYLGVGEMDAEFFAAMEGFPVLECEAASPVIFGPLYFEADSYYQSFFSEFARQLEYWRKLFGTNVTAAELWTRNTLVNLKPLLGAPDLSALEGRFSGRTMVLVSAGPSLDDSLEFVRGVEDEAIIVAVNSSYLPLRKAGIVPHFVLAADPNEDTAKGFRGVDVEGTLLICPFIVHPEVATRFEGAVFTWSDSNLLASYLRLKLGERLGACVRELGTVAACSFDVARVFGCSRLILVGQDFAVRLDGKVHASGSFYDERGEASANLESCRWLPGNTIEKVPVEEKLYVYLKTFEALIAENEDSLEVINTARQGARVAGARYESVESATLSPGGDSARALFAKIDRSDALRFDSSLPILAEFRDYLMAIAKIGLKGAMTGEQVEGRMSQAQAKEILELRDRLTDALREGSDFYKIFQESSLKYEMLQANRVIRASRESGSGPILEESVELIERFWAYAEAAFCFACDIDRVMDQKSVMSDRKGASIE